jgi:hypothetical protein
MVRIPIRGLAFALAVALVVSSCSGKEEKAEGTADRDWRITLVRDGATYKLPVTVMSVFLAEDESYPEKFKIEGDGLQFVGEFPAGVHVGYGVNWSVLIDRPVDIQETYNFWGTDEPSYLTFPDLPRYRVLGGTFTVAKTGGTTAGVDGDLSIHGKIVLKVNTPLGEETLEGTFVIHGVTWG